MKTKCSVYFSCVLMNLCLTLGGLFCLISAFHFPVQTPKLILLLVGEVLIVSLLAMFRWRTMAFFSLGALALGYMLVHPPVELLQACSYVYAKLCGIYGKAYSISFPAWGMAQNADACMELFAILGCGISVVNAWHIGRRRNIWGPLVVSVLPLALCLVVLDTPPATWCLLLLLLGVSLLLLSQNVRRRSGRESAYLSFCLLAPMTLLLGGLYWLLPQQPYTRQAWADRLMEQATAWMTPEETVSQSAGPTTLTGIQLQNVGPMAPMRTGVLEVHSPMDGSLYLRRTCYGAYSGTEWKTSEMPEGESADLYGLRYAVRPDGLAWEVQVKLDRPEEFLYTGYYAAELPESGSAMGDVAVQNKDRVISYSLWLSNDCVSRTDTQGYEAQLDRYLELPPETRVQLQEILVEAGIWMPEKPRASWETKCAQDVAALVRDSARYDLNTPQMPRGEDFVLWFLQSSETGYCIHFASAATAMLRALNIPARLVTGYLVDAKANTWRKVTQANAHAWVEYYVSGVGWIPLEATPEAGVASTAQGAEEPDSTPPPNRPEPETQEATATRPAPTAPASSKEPEQETGQVALWPLWLVGIVILALVQRPIRVQIARQRRSRGGRNQQLLAHWKYSIRMARLLPAPQPEQLQKLAMKARFSQHTVTPAELNEVLDWENRLQQELSKSKRAFLAKWILALI